MPDSSDPNDPWKRRKQDEPAPPDLDEIFAKLAKRLNQLDKSQRFKRKFSGKGTGGGAGTASSIGIGFIVAILFLIWFLSGIFIIAPAERGVVLRFGRYQKTVGPGPHWIPRFIKSVKVVNVQRIATFSYNADMLTKDENIVFVFRINHYDKVYITYLPIVLVLNIIYLTMWIQNL